MSTELGTGWIRIAADVSGITPEVSKALDAAQPIADKQGKSMGTKLVGSLGGAVKGGVLAVGASAGAMLGASITKGLGRLTNIEAAEAKLTGLGNSAEQVAGIMDNALASVRGTAYGMDAAATTAAMVVASGIEPGKRLEQVLTTVADTAGIAGASMDEMGAIFGSVAARGKLQGDDLMQLTSRGIPVLQMLADELGVTAQEVSKMVSEGKVDFETFETALRNHIGGAAKEAGKTTQGAFANMWAAASRFGANISGPLFDQAAGAFTGITDAIDTLSEKSTPFVEKFDKWLDGAAIPKLKEFGQTAKEATIELANNDEVRTLATQTKDAFTDIIKAGAEVVPAIGQVAGQLAKASAAIGVSGWKLFVDTLTVGTGVIKAITPPLETLASFMEDHPGLVTAAIAAYAGFKTIPGWVDKASGVLQPHVERLGKVKTALADLGPGISDIKTYYADTGREIGTFDATMQLAATSHNQAVATMGRAYTQASGPLKEMAANHKLAAAEAKEGALLAGDSWTAADHLIAQAGHGVAGTVTGMAGTLKGVGSGAFAGIKTAASGVVDFLGGPWTAGIMGATYVIADARAASASLDSAQESMARSTRDASKAQSELTAALAGTTGAMGEQELAAAARIVKSELSEIVELGGRKFSIAENISMATVAVDELAGKIPGLTTETGRANTEATRSTRELKETYEALKEGAKRAGLSIEEVNDVIAKGGPEYDALIAQLRGSGDAGARAADQMESARGKIENIVDAAVKVDPSFAQASAAVDVLADSASSGSDKLTALEKIMESMGLVPKMAEEALMDAAAAVDEIVATAENSQLPVDTLGDALFGLDGKLEPTNESARLLHDNMSDLRKQLQEAAISGADTQEAFDLMQPALQALKDQFGLTDDQLQKLIKSYGLVPDTISTIVSVDGTSKATQDLASVWSQLNGLEKGKTINVGVVDEKAVADLEELGYKVQQLPDGTVEVTSNGEAAAANLQKVVDRMAEIDGTDVSVDLAMDNTRIELDAQRAHTLIAELDIQNPTPQAQMIIDDLQSSHSIAMGDLAVLAAQSPKPAADLDKVLLDAGVDAAHASLRSLQETKTKPPLDADTSPLEKAVERAKRLLASITGAKVSIGGTGGGSSRFANGGRVPQLATGGRLPTTGPGTGIVDGFLGIDAAGMPTVRVNRGEWVVNDTRSAIFDGTLNALNSGTQADIISNLSRELPALTGNANARKWTHGAPGTLPGLAGGGVIESITATVRKHFPMMTITSTQRNSNDYHGVGKAVDFSNGTAPTPEMHAAASFFAENFGGELLELIHSPFEKNIKNGKVVGNGMGLYGPQTMAQHRNHVHVAADAPLSKKVAKPVPQMDDASADLMSPKSRTSREMQWKSAEKVDIDFGSASAMFKGVSKALRLGERKDFQVGTTKETRESLTPSAIAPLTQSSNTARKGWGHDFFVEEIARSASARHLPAEGAMIGVGTAFVESGNPIRMYANKAVPDSLQFRHDAIGADHDSVGLFQQRQAGWGTLAQRMDPFQSAGLFFDAMLRKFPNWAAMNPGAVAQGVQVSAFPDRYGKVMGAALEAVKNTSLYDAGGWLMDKSFALNLSGKPEPVLTHDQWGDVRGTVRAVPQLVRSIDRLVPVLAKIAQTGEYTGSHGLPLPENSSLVVAAQKLYVVGQELEIQAATLEKNYYAAGRQLAKWTDENLRFFDNTEIVMDAEAGLQATRQQNAQDLENLRQAEKQLAEARSNLAAAQKEDTKLSLQTQRKIADAERRLEEARNQSVSTSKNAETVERSREAKAKKIEDAERNLARVREDAANELKKQGSENAESVVTAMEDVQKAEEQLANARHNVTLISARTEAAERTLAGARLQVVHDLVTKAKDTFDGAFSSLGRFIDQATRFGGVVWETQQTISKLAQDQVNLNLAAIKSVGDLRIAEWDVSRARMEGIVDVATAEADLAAAREGHLVMGATAVSSLGDAVDRFRILGMDAADELGTQVVTNTDEIKAAEAALAKARASAAIIELDAQNRVKVAAIAAAKAGALQAQNAAILAVHTEKLAQQSAQLNGMNNTQQTALKQRVEGGAKTAGGILGILGGVVLGAIGVATMNPALIAAGVGVGAKGIANTATGASILKNHDKKAADEAWNALDKGDKWAIGLGAGGASLASAAGIGAAAYTGNAEWATAGLDAGAQIWDASITGIQERQQAAFDKIDAEYADAMAAIDAKYSSQLAELDAAQAAVEADFQMKREALVAEEAYQELQKRISEASSKAEAEALVKAAEVAEARRDDLLAAARETNELLKQSVSIQIPAGQAWTSDQLETYLAGLFDEINAVKADVSQIRAEKQPTGLDIIMAGR